MSKANLAITENTNVVDNYINKVEYELTDGQLHLIYTLPEDFGAGTIITIRASNNMVLPEYTVQKNDIADGNKVYYPYPIQAPKDGESFELTTELFGDSSYAKLNNTITTDITPPPTPIVDIALDKDHDGYINVSEKPEDGKVPVRISFDKDVIEAGDTPDKITITSNVEPKEQVIAITDKDKENGYIEVKYDEPANGDLLKVSAIIKDKAGNLSKEGEAEVEVKFLTELPGKPTVDILDGGDGILNASELKASVLVKIDLPDNAKVGDILNIYNGDEANPSLSISLFKSHIDKGSITTLVSQDYVDSVKGIDGATLVVKADIKDIAGNVSEKGNDSSIVDISLPNGNERPIVEILEDVNNDGYINKAEKQGDLDVK